MKSERKISIITQISILAIAGLILVGIATFFSQLNVSNIATTDNIKSRAANIAAETAATVMEYPAHDWLIRYWYEHADELDIEYDAGYNAGTATEGKVALLQSRHPELRLEYASEQELEALSEEDQKLYAEITYSWLTTRIDRVKQSHSVDYLFCVITDTEGSNAYKDQFFLFSGAEPGAVRGYNYTEVYPLGKEVSVAENQSQQDAMRTATENSLASTEQYEGYLADAGDYIDYYSFLTMIDDRAVIIGMTYDLSGIMSSIRTQTMEGTGYSMIYLVLLMMFISGVKMRYFIIIFAVIAVAVLGLAVTGNLGYAMTRLDGWGQALIYTDDDLWQTTYQTRNSLYAIGSGGFWGLGLGQSRQKYLYIPEVQNDFVFAVVCEELGFIGAAIILCLFALLVWRGITISMRAQDKFGSLLGIGLSAQIGLQVILNIMVITDWLPNTGISLPFFSFGGSSLIMLLAQMGIILSISRTSNLEKA